MRTKENYAAFLTHMHALHGDRINLTDTGFWKSCIEPDSNLQMDGEPYGIYKKVAHPDHPDVIGSSLPSCNLHDLSYSRVVYNGHEGASDRSVGSSDRALDRTTKRAIARAIERASDRAIV